MDKEIAPKKMTVIIGDIQTFYPEFLKFNDDNIVHEKHFSSQVVQMPNPNFIKGITDKSQPEFVMSAFVSAVIFYTPKKVESKLKTA